MNSKIVASLLTLAWMLVPTLVSAQQAASITGVARDATGGVMPGVTVEVTSPALIEKVRTAVTDTYGQYRIVELRPGTYTVTFTLTGFNTSRREGVELTGGFTATVNGELRVGTQEETVTVTGTSPLVDVQNARQQMTITDELLTELPAATMSFSSIGAITPGLNANRDVGGASGVYSAANTISVNMHGKSGAKTTYDGLKVGHLEASGSAGYIISPATVEEWTLETGGGLAESSTSGLSANVVPKEGGNSIRGIFSGYYTTEALQANNLTDELRARGLTTVNKVLYVFDGNFSIGGPIKRDRLWFFAAYREADSQIQIAGLFFNKTQGTPLYTPDPDRPAFRDELLHSPAGRLTWQASQKNKVNFFAEIQKVCVCRGRGENVAPEVAYKWDFFPQGPIQVTWSSPLTNRLLLEAGGGVHFYHWPVRRQPEVRLTDIGILEQSTGFSYNAMTGFNVGAYGNIKDSDRYSQRFAASYVTGAHAFKAGVQLEEGVRTNSQEMNGEMSFRFNLGVPNRITQVATPYLEEERFADIGLFVQDRWTVKRLTLNGGLRFDYFNGYIPEQHLPAGQWVPARDFAPVKRVPNWTDLSPRLGAAYDLAGDGKTALKVSLGKYVGIQAVQIASTANPVVASVNSVNRTWDDLTFPQGDPRRQNFLPDCDLKSPISNGECGAFDNQNFGQLNIRTRYDDEVIHGFGKRDYLWDLATEVQRQLGSKTSVTVGYYGNWSANFTATDNLEVTPADYGHFCVRAPVDTRLPDGGGYEICGLYDQVPAKLGFVNNLISPASKFGKQQRVNDFFAVNLSTRFGPGMQFGGGVDTGRTVTDSCFVVDSPQLLDCRVVTPFKGQTQIKLYGTYRLPADVTVSGTLQNSPGPVILANWAAPNSAIFPSLGRNLGACGASVTCNATATVALIRPQTMFEDRRTQLDLRVSKRLLFGTRYRLQANLDIYNVLNGSAVDTINTAYGPTWLRPIGNPNSSGAIMQGRLFAFGGQMSF